MTVLQLLVVSVAALPAFVSESYAGACASEIAAMQARVDAGSNKKLPEDWTS